MKKLAMSLLAIGAFSAASFGQNDDYVKRSTLGVNFFFNDFKTPQHIKATSLSQTLRDGKFGKIKDMNAGISVSYLKGITKTFDFSTTLAGSFLDYPIAGKLPFGSDNFLLEGDLMVNAKMFSDKYWVSPYVSAGVGGSTYKGYWGAFVPVGLGLQVNFFDDAFLMINSQYRFKVSDNVSDHFYHSIGFAGNIGPERKPKVIPPPPLPVVVPPKDTDGDGIVDSLDACPAEFGLAALQGCPDRDKDGIADKNDKCPDVAGIARYEGCPIPDTDKDGINDEEDKCKDVPGVARYQGCPVPDTDGDGINDEEDKCPNAAGPASNKGCPIIGIDAYKVVFKSGSAILLPEGKKELDKAVAYLKEHDGFDIMIEGHTDNTGSAKINNPLSAKRAEAVKAYFVKNGVAAERLYTQGFGATTPVADNKTAAGRKLNRRIEVKMKH